MGFLFGRENNHTASTSSTGAADLAKKIRSKGGASSSGATVLLRLMEQGQDPQDLCPELAEGAARSFRDVARKLPRDARRLAENIAASAEHASRTGRTWTVG
ncbi:hypothetical protein [Streptosporangium sp. NPDC051022]|uniref:DUF7739 domain-containing protein n=1 Tax=Streptosporangium sp. NPDC051022 TaxID=3155752 RepID=UPI0034440563